MPVTFGGSPLVCEDAGGQLQGWLDQYLALEDLRDQSKTASLASNRGDSRSGYRSKVGLPRPNYPAPPRAKLFTLYWPTGASRWARAYYLATDSQLEAFEVEESEGNSPLPLVISDGTNEITTEMYMLPPRRITAVTPEGPTEGLWLLPLVDVRFYWQLIDAGPFRYGDDNDFTTWTGVFEKISTQLGITIEPDDTSAYNIPDPDELTRSYENIAVLLDGIAHSLGQRIVRQLDGTVTSSNWETSTGVLEENTAEPLPLLGGDFSESLPSAFVPEKVRVVFPKWHYGAVDPYGGLYASEQEASEFTEATPIEGLVKTIHTCAFADFSLASSVPDNAAEVNELAEKIAADFYEGLAFRYDYSFGGVRAWELSGFDDCAEWCFGRKHHLPTYQAFTRVQSAPTNFGVEEQLSQFKDTPVYPSLTRFKLDAALSPGGNAMGFHVKGDNGSYTATTDKIKVYDFLSKFSGQKGAQGWAQFKGDSLRWEIVEMKQQARFVDCTLSGSLAASGSVSATVNGHFDGDAPMNPDGTTATTINVSMPPLDGLPTIASGKKIRAVWNDVVQRYEALQWGCA